MNTISMLVEQMNSSISEFAKKKDHLNERLNVLSEKKQKEEADVREFFASEMKRINDEFSEGTSGIKEEIASLNNVIRDLNKAISSLTGKKTEEKVKEPGETSEFFEKHRNQGFFREIIFSKLVSSTVSPQSLHSYIKETLGIDISVEKVNGYLSGCTFYENTNTGRLKMSDGYLEHPHGKARQIIWKQISSGNKDIAQISSIVRAATKDKAVSREAYISGVIDALEMRKF